MQNEEQDEKRDTEKVVNGEKQKQDRLKNRRDRD